MNVVLKEVELPDFGMPTVEPKIGLRIYQNRIKAALERAKEAELDVLLVYADREHSANMHYLTGFDPRFEEAVLILTHNNHPVILVGNECRGHVDVSPVPMKKVMFQDFSLLGQPRDNSETLASILKTAGISSNSTVGTVGWKYFVDSGRTKIPGRLEIPSYIADTLRAMAGSVVNATDIFMGEETGLRTINEVEQLAVFEYAGTLTSSAIKNVLFGIKPGMSEYEAVQLMHLKP